MKVEKKMKSRFVEKHTLTLGGSIKWLLAQRAVKATVRLSNCGVLGSCTLHLNLIATKHERSRYGSWGHPCV